MRKIHCSYCGNHFYTLNIANINKTLKYDTRYAHLNDDKIVNKILLYLLENLDLCDDCIIQIINDLEDILEEGNNNVQKK